MRHGNEPTDPTHQEGAAVGDDIRAAGAGDERAFRRLVESTVPVVVRGLRAYFRDHGKVLGREELDQVLVDAAADGVRRAVRSWDPTGGASFTTWARWQAMNQARRTLRSRVRRVEAERRYAELAPVLQGADEHLEAEESSERIRRVLDGLPIRQAVLLLAAYQDEGRGRIARLATAMGVPEQKLRNDLRAAKAAFARSWREAERGGKRDTE